MKALLMVMLCALVAGSFADRSLLAPALSPTPSPAPSTSCPPKQNPGADCITQATAFQSDCAAYITKLNSATKGQVTATSDTQISALVAQLGAAPTAQCCTTSKSLLQNACMCDTTVQTLAKSVQGLSPSEFQTVGKVFLVACGVPTCYDTCQLPASTAG